MAKVRKRGEEVRRFILENVADHPRDIVRVTMDRFGITRPAVHEHIKRMTSQQAIVKKGSGPRGTTYHLGPDVPWSRTFGLAGLSEDEVFYSGIRPQIEDLPDNVINLWATGVTEMVNNAIDHSEGAQVRLAMRRTPESCEVSITDDGVGIFRKIMKAANLQTERDAFLELRKGGFTTDPSKHSGQGIFFASRMFDLYSILSGGLVYGHRFENPRDDLLIDSDETDRDAERPGTTVFMRLGNHTARTPKEIYDMFTTSTEEDELAFSKTIVPVRLAKRGDEFLVSRSQAKRLLAGLDKFSVVLLDFERVEAIGQAFADEIFRVFPKWHPEVEIREINATPRVLAMINRARHGG